MLKDISELEIGCVYQFVNDDYDVLGLHDRIEITDDTIDNNTITKYWFKTISSVENRWPLPGFWLTKEYIKHLTRLS